MPSQFEVCCRHRMMSIYIILLVTHLLPNKDAMPVKHASDKMHMMTRWRSSEQEHYTQDSHLLL